MLKKILKKQLPSQYEPKFINFKQPKNNMVNHIEEPITNNHIINKQIIDKHIIDKLNTNLNNVLPNHSCTISTEDEDAVEIYSNDNIEDISSQKTSEIDENDIIIKEPILIGQNIINQVIHDIYQEDNSLTSSISIEEIILNNESPELINKDDIINSPTNNIEQFKLEQLKLEQLKLEQLKSEQLKSEQHISDDNEEPKIEIKVDNLIKEKKLNELKEMAKQLNIELKYNGK